MVNLQENMGPKNNLDKCMANKKEELTLFDYIKD